MKKILGTMRLPETHELILEWLRAAHKEGIDWIDTAWIYGQTEVEKRLGPALTELKNEGINFKIQSKIWPTNYKELKKYFDEQLQALEITKIDSMLLHRPSLNFNDDIQAWKDLIELQKEGLVETIGVSNYDKDHFGYFISKTGVKPSINQIESSVSNFRDDRVNYCKSEGIEIQGWSSFGKNVKANIEHPTVQSLAQKYSVAPGTILTSFLSSQNITPINASLNISHLSESINTISLSEEEIYELKKLNKHDNKAGALFPRNI